MLANEELKDFFMATFNTLDVLSKPEALSLNTYNGRIPSL
jgi:hypothetical protein